MDDSKPKSKLAALAAARRKKENLRKGEGQGHETASAALLDKLTKKTSAGGGQESPSSRRPEKPAKSFASSTLALRATWDRKTIPVQSDEPVQTASVKADHVETSKASQPVQQDAQSGPVAPLARPSAFAETIFSPSSYNSSQAVTQTADGLIFRAHSRTDTKDNPFLDPSPDDVVLKAQSGKGSTRTT